MVEKSNNHLRDELARPYQHVQVQREAPLAGCGAPCWTRSGKRCRRWGDCFARVLRHRTTRHHLI